MKIENARPEDKKALMELYDLCFPGEHGYCEYYHDNFWNPEKTLVIRDGKGIAAMVNLMEYRMARDEEEIKVVYIFAAAARPDRRGEGLMGSMLEKSFELSRQWGADASILITQEDSLFGYYKRFGYEPVFSVSKVGICENPPANMCKVRILNTTDAERLVPIYEYFTKGRTAVKRDKKRFEEIIEEYGEHAYGLIDFQGNMIAYCLMDEKDEYAVEVMGEGCGYLLYVCCMDMDKGFGRGLPTGENDIPIGCAKALTEKGREMIFGKGLPPYINILFN